MMTLEQAKEYTRETLKPYYTEEEIEKAFEENWEFGSEENQQKVKYVFTVDIHW